MREFEEIYSLRRREVDIHLTFVDRLHEDVRERTARGPIDIEHLNILKSAFLVHLYNVVESVMAKIVDEVAETAKVHDPHSWVDGLFIAWIRHRAAVDADMSPNDRLSNVIKIVSEATGRSSIGSTRVARREGNWSHSEIEAIAENFVCNLSFRPDIKEQACIRFFLNDMPPVKYVRHMRNQLSHGNLSFVDAAAALSIQQLMFLKEVVMTYMEDVVTSFTAYLDQRKFLRSPAA